MVREWYFQAMGQELGPYSAAEIKAKVASGQIQPDTLIRKGIEGTWVFGAKVKGLFAPAAESAPPSLTPVTKTKSSATLPIPNVSKPGTSTVTANREGPVTNSATSFPASIPLADDESDGHSPSLEFYDFVGFREAISPILHDALKRFIFDHEITMSQLNRRALANFIRRPELASDVVVTAVVALPQAVSRKWNQDGSHPLSDREKVESATFHVTLFNGSLSQVYVNDVAFLPESVEQRTYDTIEEGFPVPLDHTGHIPVRLSPLVVGKSIHVKLDLAIPPQSSREISVWFHDRAKPSLILSRGQLLIGYGTEMAMSEFFMIVIHGDSPSPLA